MAYEVRIDSKPVGTFDDAEAALDRVPTKSGAGRIASRKSSIRAPDAHSSRLRRRAGGST